MMPFRFMSNTLNISGGLPPQPLDSAICRGLLWPLLQLPRQAGDTMTDLLLVMLS